MDDTRFPQPDCKQAGIQQPPVEHVQHLQCATPCLLDFSSNTLQRSRCVGFTHGWQWLTAHNWQKWKRVFLTCPCHKIYRDKAVGLKSCKNTWKITIFVKMWNFGAISWKFDILSITAWLKLEFKRFFCTCVTHYNYDYLTYSTFRFNFIDFQLYIDFPFQFYVFYCKIT